METTEVITEETTTKIEEKPAPRKRGPKPKLQPKTEDFIVFLEGKIEALEQRQKFADEWYEKMIQYYGQLRANHLKMFRSETDPSDVFLPPDLFLGDEKV